MSALTATPDRMTRLRPAWKTLARFLATPKGFTLVALLALAAAAEARLGTRVITQLLAAAGAAAAADLALVWAERGRLSFPSGALLSGLFVGMVLSLQAAWILPPLAAAIAVVSKHLIRTRWSNVFNPAALALVVSFFLFHSEQSWWGALPDLPVAWLLLVLAAGLYVAARVNKLPLMLVFLGASLGAFTVAAFAGDPGRVAEIFRTPDVNMLLFFAAFMLTDPPTSPARQSHQVWFGLLVAAAACTAFLTLGALWFLTGGLLVGNGWESLRRLLHRRAVLAGRADPVAE